ncbi:glycosyltransferase family 4 protein [Roseibium aggregatum]|uniref:glycosyltransferase family 4 protein n=1 Tax=Roseibium aggregatum TaxID=187304 RepID=UPI003A985009
MNCGYMFSESNGRLTHTLPHSRAYFFSHYAIAYNALAAHQHFFKYDSYLWFTHPNPDKGVDDEDFELMCKAFTHVFTPCSINRRLLEALNCPSEKITVPLGGADPALFPAHDRGKGKVAFVGAYYNRKQPDKMLELIRSMPDVEFLLLGPHEEEVSNANLLWRHWQRYDELAALENLQVVEAKYEQFPEYFGQTDLLVSLSELEGGPIPLIEAMMCNAWVIATRTGFAEDVILEGQNGYVVDIDVDLETLSSKIRELLARTDDDVRSFALNYSWQSFAKTILDVMYYHPELGETVRFGKEDRGQQLLRRGWRKGGQAGIWSTGPKSTLRLPLPEHVRKHYRLSLELRGKSESKAKTQSYLISIAGVADFRVEIATQGEQIVEMTFESKEDLETITVEFKGENERAPIKLFNLVLDQLSEAENDVPRATVIEKAAV